MLYPSFHKPIERVFLQCFLISLSPCPSRKQYSHNKKKPKINPESKAKNGHKADLIAIHREQKKIHVDLANKAYVF